VSCVHCGGAVTGRRDRLYCSRNCSKRASEKRRQAGTAPPSRWQHPALDSDNPALRAAAVRAEQLGEAHGWWTATSRIRVLDALTAVLHDRPPDQLVPLSEVRARTARYGCGVRVVEVLADLGLLDDDTHPAIRAWIERRSAELAAGFAPDVRAWLLVLLDGDARSRPRAANTIYAYYGAVRPVLQGWTPTRGHLREITATDVTAALEPLRGWRRSNAITALHSLFRFATRRRIVFTNPTSRLTNPGGDRSLLPMTDTEIRVIETSIVTAAQRLVVALAAVHAASATTIRHLTLDHVDLPNWRIIIDGVAQPLGSLTHNALRTWIEHRRDTWPHTPNRHLVISRGTANGLGPVGHSYLTNRLLPAGVTVDRIRSDRVLQEALSVGPDPLHLSLVFNLAHTTAGRYAAFARDLLDDQLQPPANSANPPPGPADVELGRR
jgi:hypothetical protein